MYFGFVWVIYKVSYLFAEDQEHTGHGQLHQHQDEQQDEELGSVNQIKTLLYVMDKCNIH